MGEKTVTRTVNDTRYTDIVHHSKRMTPETEVLLYGDELKNDYRVLSTELVHVDLNDYRVLSIYRNRWATVKRIRFEDSGVYFVLKYDDGDMIIRQCAETSAWWVTKESMAAVEEREEQERRERGNPLVGLQKFAAAFGPKSKPGFKTDEEIDNDGTPVSGVAYEAPETEKTDEDPTEGLIERHGEPTRTTGVFETNEPGGPIVHGIETHPQPTQTSGGLYEV